MQFKKILLSASSLLLILFITFSSASARPQATFSYIKTDLLDGFWRYDFTVQNRSARGECLHDIKINFFDPDVFGFALPSGWESVLWEGWHVTNYLQVKADSGLCGLTAGSSQSGFNFKANYDFRDLHIRAKFLRDGDSVKTRGRAELTATTVVPEPISYILFFSGGLTIGFTRYLKTRKSR